MAGKLLSKKSLYFILINVVGNALFHNPKGTVIEILIEEKADQLSFIIKDDGVGIAAETVKSIIEAHGGTVTVESDLTLGTSFTFPFSIYQK